MPCQTVVIEQRAVPRAHPVAKATGYPARAGHRQGWSLGGDFPQQKNYFIMKEKLLKDFPQQKKYYLN